jgi:hypothetical protein
MGPLYLELRTLIVGAGMSLPCQYRTCELDELTAASVAAIVKAPRAARLALDPASFAGHSLRAGFVMSAAARGASLFDLMDVTGHKSVDALRGYVRDAELFKDHAGAGLL